MVTAEFSSASLGTGARRRYSTPGVLVFLMFMLGKWVGFMGSGGRGCYYNADTPTEATDDTQQTPNAPRSSMATRVMGWREGARVRENLGLRFRMRSTCSAIPVGW